MFHRKHLSIYCINTQWSLIYVMDSLDYARLKKKFTHNHHQPTMNLIQNRLNDALQTISKRSFPNFANWRRIRTVIPFTTPTKGDCAACLQVTWTFRRCERAAAYRFRCRKYLQISPFPLRNILLQLSACLHLMVTPRKMELQREPKCCTTCCSTNSISYQISPQK
jgi:hypothetical protein